MELLIFYPFALESMLCYTRKFYLMLHCMHTIMLVHFPKKTSLNAEVSQSFSVNRKVNTKAAIRVSTLKLFSCFVNRSKILQTVNEN